MKKTLLSLACILVAHAAAGQLHYDPGVISPYLENPGNPLAYTFTSYSSGASEAGFYYLFPTNITGYVTSPRNYQGECVYKWTEVNTDKEIAEDVIIYRGTDSIAAFTSGSPFTAMRTASPCFDGRSGEVSEQANRTWSYGGGDTDFSPAKNKYYILVNRVHGRTVVQNGRNTITGGDWSAGDFREVFIGAKDTLAGAASTGVGTSGRCRGEIVPTTDPDYCAFRPFAYKLSPLVVISTIGGATYETLTPIVGAVNTASYSLPLFSNMPSDAVLFGFMHFGKQTEFPSRIAAVAITDSSTGIRPSNAVLYYRSGGVFVPTSSGTMTQLPDDVSSSLGTPLDVHDMEYDAAQGWLLYGKRAVLTNAGCNDGAPGQGVEFTETNLATLVTTGFWASQNDLGRMTVDVHTIGKSKFVLYSSTDRRCITDPMTYQTDTGLNQWRSMEILVRDRTAGPPN